MSEKKESKLIRFAYYAVPILFVLYVLSIGPSYAIVMSFGCNPRATIDYAVARDAYDSFYAPVLWVEDKNQPINKLLSKYKRHCVDTMYQHRSPIPHHDS